MGKHPLLPYYGIYDPRLGLRISQAGAKNGEMWFYQGFNIHPELNEFENTKFMRCFLILNMKLTKPKGVNLNEKNTNIFICFSFQFFYISSEYRFLVF